MKNDSNQLEILLVTTSSFANRQLCETDTKEINSSMAPEERLEAACWNGLLDELLPEIMSKKWPGEKVFIWQVEKRKSYLSIFFGAEPSHRHDQFSLDPQVFHAEMHLN